MKHGSLTFCLGTVAVLIVAGCGKRQPATEEPPIKMSSPATAQPFQRQVYQSFDGGHTLTLISPEECELSEGNTILLCKYNKQAGDLRVVTTVMGSNQVLYYHQAGENLQTNDGIVLLSAKELSAAKEHAIQVERQRQQEQDRRRKITIGSRIVSKKLFTFDKLRDDNVISAVVSDTEVMLHFRASSTDKHVWFGDIYSLRVADGNAKNVVVFWLGDPFNGGGIGQNLTFEDDATAAQFYDVIIEAMLAWRKKFPDALLPETIARWYDQTARTYSPATEIAPEDGSGVAANESDDGTGINFDFRLNRFGGIILSTVKGSEHVRVYQGSKQGEETVFEAALSRIGDKVYSTPGGTQFALKHLDIPVINDANRHLDSGDWEVIVSGRGSEFEALKPKMPSVTFGSLPPLQYLGERVTDTVNNGVLTPPPDKTAVELTFRARRAEAKLNELYSRLRAGLNPAGKTALKQEQLKWLRDRESVKADLLRQTEMTEARNAEFERALKNSSR